MQNFFHECVNPVAQLQVPQNVTLNHYMIVSSILQYCSHSYTIILFIRYNVQLQPGWAVTKPRIEIFIQYFRQISNNQPCAYHRTERWYRYQIYTTLVCPQISDFTCHKLPSETIFSIKIFKYSCILVGWFGWFVHWK